MAYKVGTKSEPLPVRIKTVVESVIRGPSITQFCVRQNFQISSAACRSLYYMFQKKLKKHYAVEIGLKSALLYASDKNGTQKIFIQASYQN